MSKILIIEDNFEVADNLAEILELSGYEAEVARNGKEGVAKANEILPSLILCDVMMPELDGFGVQKILSSSDKTKHIPLIFLTAKADKQDFRKGMNLGAVDYITKPFDDSELLEAIKLRLQKFENTSKANDHTDVLYNENLVRTELKKLCEGEEIRQISAKSFIYRQGKNPYHFFYIKSGIVKISIENEIGKSITTNIYVADSVIGLSSILSEQRYSNNAICLTESEVCLIPKEKLLQTIEERPKLKTFLLKSLSNSLIHANQSIINQAYGSVQFKVAQALLMLDDAFENKPLRISRDEIAELAGTAKESTIRMLSTFKNDGILEIEGTEIKIINREELETTPI